MRSLKVIIFRDTDKPYTLILSPALMIALSFSLVAITSLLTFSVISNVLLLSEDTAAGSDRSAAAADRTGRDEAAVAEGAEVSGTAEPDATPAETHEGVAEPEESTSELPAAENNLEPWIADDCMFSVQVIGGPDFEAGEVSIDTRVSKEVDRGRVGSGRYVAALVTSDGLLEPVFPTEGMVRAEGSRIVNPEDGELFRIAYSRDISFSFAAGDAEQHTTLAIFLFDAETRRLLCRTIIELSAR